MKTFLTKIMEQNFVISTNIGTVELKNEYGGIVFGYGRF